MFKVETINAARIGATAGKKRVAGSGNFVQFLGEETPATETSQPVSGLLDMDVFLAFQGLESLEGEAKKKAIQEGKKILDALRTLQQMLLSGTIDAEQESLLYALAEAPPGMIQDKELEEALQQIRVRARVELAKLELT